MGHRLVWLVLALGVRLAGAELPRPYLMSCSFSVPTLETWTVETAKAAAATPYHGIAARLYGAYDVKPVPTVESYAAVIQAVHDGCPDKQIWPWVFLNRMIARNASSSHQSAPDPTREGAKAFAGLDLDGQGGAKAVFLQQWRMSLELAKQLGAPGILFDPEAYSDYRIYFLSQLAGMRGEEIDTTRQQVAALGAELADICGEVFPDVAILTLFTRWEGQTTKLGTVPALFDGMLRRAKELGLGLKIYDGGETVGYCMLNLQHLQRRHDRRMFKLLDVLQTYPEGFQPAATISPWDDPAARTNWQATWADCKNSELKSLLDFEPLFVELLRRYPLVWIYAAGATPYKPLDPEHNSRFGPVLQRAVEAAAEAGPLAPGSGGVPAMDGLRPTTDDLALQADRWTLGGGPEGTLKTNDEGVRFEVKVDQQHGQGEYLSGWLILTLQVGDLPLDPAPIGVEFDVRFKAPGMLRVGLVTAEGGKPEWYDLEPTKLGEWQHERLPLAILSLAQGRPERLQWYIAEAWYADGSDLAFDLKNVKLLGPGE